jgi:hypothetical protein
MSAQSPTQLTPPTSTDLDRLYDPVAATGPTLIAGSAEMPDNPGIFYGTHFDSHFNELTGNTLATSLAAAPGIKQQHNSHIDLWALLAVAVVAGFLSEITHRKKRQNRTHSKHTGD